jgi:hypothetical protein
MNLEEYAISMAAMICLAGGEAAANPAQLQTEMGIAKVTADGCGPVDVGRVKKYGDAKSATATCVFSTGNSDIGILLSEATAPITAVPAFASKSSEEIRAMPEAEPQDLLTKWLRSNLRDTFETIGKGWSSVTPKVQRISAGSLARGPYVCARYTQSSRNSKVKLYAQSIGLRCARLSKGETAIEEVAVQTTAFFSIGQSAPENFGAIADNAIKSLRYVKK